ncbi:MAG: flavodoxin family protein [Actinobacteria bacterium]|nr:flavodoxin family protein [Actinomycetota bacterium]
MDADRRPLVLCVAGSPRRQGNSSQLLDACAEGIEVAGGVADWLVLADHTIKPCINCGGCSSTGHCVLRDDMTAIYPRIDRAEAIVVASPVYFATVTATLKGFYDRCQPYWARRYAIRREDRTTPVATRRPGALLLVGAGGDPYGHEAAVIPTRSVFANLEVDYAEELVVEGPDGFGDIARYPDSLRAAQDIGWRVTELARTRRAL